MKKIGAKWWKILPTESSLIAREAARMSETSIQTAISRKGIRQSKMTFANVQAQGDGSTHTLMFAESINAEVWTGITAPDRKWHYGFCWEQPDTIGMALTGGVSNPQLASDPRYRIINGAKELLPKVHGDKAPNSGFPSGHHPGGVNVAFVGGQVIYLSDRISPVVYAQLMTSNRKRSNLVNRNNPDRDLPLPDADDYWEAVGVSAKRMSRDPRKTARRRVGRNP